MGENDMLVVTGPRTIWRRRTHPDGIAPLRRRS
jgi:hypothetical protein